LDADDIVAIDGPMAGIAYKWNLSGLSQARCKAGRLVMTYDLPIEISWPRK
jgi:hypothetical protein